jgi:hypothetical protein
MEENTEQSAAETALANRRQGIKRAQEVRKAKLAEAAKHKASQATAELDLAEDDEPAPTPRPRAKPPAQRTVRVRLLKAYWPGDGREHPDAANRLSGRKHRFDAGEILDLPVEEARKLLDEHVEKRTVRVWDAKMRRWVDQDDSLHRPPVAVRANAYSVEDDA